MRDGCRSSKPVCCSALALYSERQEAQSGWRRVAGSRWREVGRCSTAGGVSATEAPRAMWPRPSARGAQHHRHEVHSVISPSSALKPECLPARLMTKRRLTQHRRIGDVHRDRSRMTGASGCARASSSPSPRAGSRWTGRRRSSFRADPVRWGGRRSLVRPSHEHGRRWDHLGCRLSWSIESNRLRPEHSRPRSVPSASNLRADVLHLERALRSRSGSVIVAIP